MEVDACSPKSDSIEDAEAPVAYSTINASLFGYVVAAYFQLNFKMILLSPAMFTTICLQRYLIIPFFSVCSPATF